jgi:predicted DNA-binding transcriptional regulator AlpA
MADQRTTAEVADPAAPVAIHAPAPNPSRKPAPLREAELLQKMLWSVPEAASVLRVGTRSMWRMLADPNSGFPRPRRICGRTLLSRDEVLGFMTKEATR